ncbi:MAG: molybdopterin molybdotransferase MoeA [Bacteroidota bacterium]
MITVKEATEIVLSHSYPFQEKLVPLEAAVGNILKENLYADQDFPPFTRVTMDGIAIKYSAFYEGQRSFPVEGVQAAGSAQLTLNKAENCFEVMTGAILPGNTDSVIRYEDVVISDGIATIQVNDIKEGQNAHDKGKDRKEGDLLIKAGTLITPAEIGVAATIGKTHLKVCSLPKTAVISTGDELVEVNEKPLPHQIRKSNVYTILSLLQQHHVPAVTFHVDDDEAEIFNVLSKAFNNFDVIILSGGVSKGKFDYIPGMLEKLGVKKTFHKVKQRPGKPFWFGRNMDTTVFALPGNPVSSFMCTCRYFLPWLRKGIGLDPLSYPHAKLASDFSFNPELTYFLQVRLNYTKDAEILAEPVEGKGSGDLANLADADGFLELPYERTNFSAGEIFPFIRYR